jgi:hypothetical protein
MAIANIEALCAGFCDMAGMPPIMLAPDNAGLRSATIRVGGVDVYAQQLDSHNADCVFLSADLGAPQDRALEAWQLLLKANLRMVGTSDPVFSRNPSTQRAMVQWAYPLADASVPDFHHRVMSLANMAGDWRDGHFLAEPDKAHAWFQAGFGPSPASQDELEAAHARFDELYRGIFKLLNHPEPPTEVTAAQDETARTFSMTLPTMEIRFVQSVNENRDSIFVVACFDPQTPDAPLDEAAAAMEVNFHLATESRSSRVAYDPEHNRFMVMNTLSLTDLTPQGLLDYTEQIVSRAISNAPGRRSNPTFVVNSEGVTKPNG